MPKISYSIGMTMHLGHPSNNEYIKMAVEVSDFDTSLPFEEQIQQVHSTFHQLAEWGEEQLSAKIEQNLGRK